MPVKESKQRDQSLLNQPPQLTPKPHIRFRLAFQAFLIIAAVYILFVMLKPSRDDSSQSAKNEENLFQQDLLRLPDGSIKAPSFLLINNGAGDQNDLFLCTIDSVVKNRNLTNSPVVSETRPILDSKAENVFYYGITASGTDIYSMNLQSGNTKSLTLHAGNTKLHTEYIITPLKEAALSPDERWIAFPAKDKKKGHTELFVAGTDSQLIWQATKFNAQIRDYLWLESNVLIIAILRDDDKVEYWKAHLDPANGFSSLVPLDL
ncbi:MAG: hypothetical protein CV087_21190 [Candidatus Brocadia sp. WS118]|nr:MAG: hypothetical protein CV087_21190 [Candidatus Brocadia sp. WS118]